MRGMKHPIVIVLAVLAMVAVFCWPTMPSVSAARTPAEPAPSIIPLSTVRVLSGTGARATRPAPAPPSRRLATR